MQVESKKLYYVHELIEQINAIENAESHNQRKVVSEKKMYSITSSALYDSLAELYREFLKNNRDTSNLLTLQHLINQFIDEFAERNMGSEQLRSWKNRLQSALDQLSEERKFECSKVADFDGFISANKQLSVFTPDIVEQIASYFCDSFPDIEYERIAKTNMRGKSGTKKVEKIKFKLSLNEVMIAHFEFSEQGLHDVRCFAWGEAISMNSSEVLFREISQHCADAWESFESNREDIHPMFAKIWIFLTWFRGYNRLFDSNSVCALCGKLLHFGTFGFLPPAYLTFELPPEPLHAFCWDQRG